MSGGVGNFSKLNKRGDDYSVLESNRKMHTFQAVIFLCRNRIDP